jgi:pyrroline-5-carboxylate reductase
VSVTGPGEPPVDAPAGVDPAVEEAVEALTEEVLAVADEVGAISRDRPLVLVGAGKMGCAMLEGWLASGMEPASIVVVEPHPSDAEVLATPGLTVQAVPPTRPAHTLVLAIKPQAMGEVLPRLRAVRDGATLVLSIAAGVTMAALARALGPGPVVRAMPNTAAAVGEAMTAAVAQDAPEGVVAVADDLLAAIGKVEWLDDEALIDAATAVSGSGPAYVFLLVECLAEAGAAEGLPPDTALALARQTVVGAGALLGRSTLDPATLRRNVTSPGGTTAAALNVLAPGGMDDLVRRAVAAAAARSRELGR